LPTLHTFRIHIAAAAAACSDVVAAIVVVVVVTATVVAFARRRPRFRGGHRHKIGDIYIYLHLYL